MCFAHALGQLSSWILHKTSGSRQGGGPPFGSRPCAGHLPAKVKQGVAQEHLLPDLPCFSTRPVHVELPQWCACRVRQQHFDAQQNCHAQCHAQVLSSGPSPAMSGLATQWLHPSARLSSRAIRLSWATGSSRTLYSTCITESRKACPCRWSAPDMPEAPVLLVQLGDTRGKQCHWSWTLHGQCTFQSSWVGELLTQLLADCSGLWSGRCTGRQALALLSRAVHCTIPILSPLEFQVGASLACCWSSAIISTAFPPDLCSAAQLRSDSGRLLTQSEAGHCCLVHATCSPAAYRKAMTAGEGYG